MNGVGGLVSKVTFTKGGGAVEELKDYLWAPFSDRTDPQPFFSVFEWLCEMCHLELPPSAIKQKHQLRRL
jgi:hypothetical protein